MKSLIGTFFELGGRNTIECLSRTGLDYIIIDNEHGSVNDETIADYIITCEVGDLLPYVRVPSVNRPSILKALDVGARGIIVPNIHKVEEVENLVSYSKFPPIGNRGYCPNRTSGWGADEISKDINKYMSYSNKMCKIIPQCETKECLDHIEEIAAMDGVDGIFVGPCDLSIDLGIPLQFDNPILIDSIKRILNACKENGKDSYLFVTNMDDAKRWAEEGFTSITYSLDTTNFTQVYKDIVDDFRG